MGDRAETTGDPSGRSIPALVPAAGRSLRMGRPKLLIELDGKPVLGRVLEALADGGASPILVIAPPMEADRPEAGPIRAIVQDHGAEVVGLVAPTGEMLESVQAGLRAWSRGTQRLVPPPPGFLLCPADSPGIRRETIRYILRTANKNIHSIITPTHGGRGGHPAYLPWDLVDDLLALPNDRGVNAVIRREVARRIRLPVDDPEAVLDLDRPEDLDRWQATMGRKDPGA